MSKQPLLTPTPQRVRWLGGSVSLAACAEPVLVCVGSPATALYPIARRLQAALCAGDVAASISAAPPAEDAPLVVHLRLDGGLPPQGYTLDVQEARIAVTGADPAGLFYGAITLVQLLDGSQGGALPTVHIEDWPDFAHRGVMLDVSRDRVPTMATLYDLVDLLAGWKINQLQLYMEHTFAYAGHETVWGASSPFTGEEMLALDAYCRERFVELVPNQNSFGHMRRWLKHDAYRPLAECPSGCELWPGDSGEPFSLCPTDPGALALLTDLYDQLLPHFSSSQFNVGLDETFDLGKGRSAALCEERGTERVYLDFLQQVHRLVRERGRTMQFWGDIILHRPDLIPDLPQDAIALEWGYEADHPFAEHCAHFAEAGLRFYVCPGTSSWNTVAGRTENALRNIQSAAMHGQAAGAEGLLNTDWGDNGHFQPLPVSYLGFLAGAAASWNAATDLLDADLPTMLDQYAFRDAAGVMGRVAYDLGNVYRLPGERPGNASVLFHLLLHPDRPLAREDGSGVTREGLTEALRALDRITASLPQARMARPDAELIRREFRWAADLLSLACRLGLARLEAGGPVAALPPSTRAALAYDLRARIAEHRALWCCRSRPGGLQDSAARLERLLRLLEA